MNKVSNTSQQTADIIRGGLELGAGAAVLGALYAYARSNKRKADAVAGNAEEGEGSMDIVVPELSPVKRAFVIEPVVGALAAGGSFMIVSKLLSEIRKKMLKDELVRAQSGYVDTLQESVKPPAPTDKEKKAGLPWWMQALLDSPRDVMLMSALASAAGSYGILENTFPRVKEKKPAGSLNRIRIKGYGTVIADGPGDGPLGRADRKSKKDDGPVPAETYLEKEEPEATSSGSGFRLPVLDTSLFQLPKAAAEGMPVRHADALRCAKQLVLIMTAGAAEKSASLLSAVLGRVAASSDGCAEVLGKTASGSLLESANELETYHAVWDELRPAEKRAAVDAAFDTPGLANTLTLLAMAELHDLHPEMTKMAADMHDKDRNRYLVMVKFGSIMYALQGLVSGFEKRAFGSDASADHDTVMEADGGVLDTASTDEERDPIDSILNPD